MCLTRVVKEKKISCIKKNGEIGWLMKEGIILICPKSGLSTSKEGQKAAPYSQIRGGTNNKQRFSIENEQPMETQVPVLEVLKTSRHDYNPVIK